MSISGNCALHATGTPAEHARIEYDTVLGKAVESAAYFSSRTVTGSRSGAGGALYESWSLERDQLRGEAGQPVELARGEARLDVNVLPFDVATGRGEPNLTRSRLTSDCRLMSPEKRR